MFFPGFNMFQPTQPTLQGSHSRATTPHPPWPRWSPSPLDHCPWAAHRTHVEAPRDRRPWVSPAESPGPHRAPRSHGMASMAVSRLGTHGDMIGIWKSVFVSEEHRKEFLGPSVKLGVVVDDLYGTQMQCNHSESNWCKCKWNEPSQDARHTYCSASGQQRFILSQIQYWRWRLTGCQVTCWFQKMTACSVKQLHVVW